MPKNIKNLEELLGVSPDSLCDSFYGQRPDWLQGYISHFDARFLFKSVLSAGVAEAVEIGTASGLSTAILGYALDVASKSGIIDSDYRVVTYDIDPMFYADKSKRVGDGAREQLAQDVLDHIVFRNPATAIDAKEDFKDNAVEFLFIDANHQHPWATLDFLTLLDCLKPGATVVLHDINLPVIKPQYADWGPKYLFDELKIEKKVPDDGEIPNIGSVIIPEDKSSLKAQLLKILFSHEWQADIPQDYLEKVGVARENA